MVSASKAARQAKRAAEGDKKKTATSKLSSKANSKNVSTASSVNGDDAEEGATSAAKMSDVKKLTEQTDKFGLSDRVTTGVLASVPSSRDVKMSSISLVFHGRVLITDSTLELTYGKRYGLLGENGCGKSTLLKAISKREFPIPEHIDIYLLNEGAPPSELGALDWVVTEAQNELDRLEKLAEEVLENEGPDSPVLEDIYEVSSLHSVKREYTLTSVVANGWHGPIYFPHPSISHPYWSRLQQGHHQEDDQGYVRWLENACCFGQGFVRQAIFASPRRPHCPS